VLCVSANSGSSCIVCETVVQYLEAMLENNKSVVAIETLLKKVCNFLPESMETKVRLVLSP